MINAIAELREKFLPVRKGKYLIGLSGGADSVALFTALLPDIREGKIRAEAVHVNHGLRGAESDGDERFCKEMCEKEGIPVSAIRKARKEPSPSVSGSERSTEKPHSTASRSVL